jgi:hypothetical protein
VLADGGTRGSAPTASLSNRRGPVRLSLNRPATVTLMPSNRTESSVVTATLGCYFEAYDPWEDDWDWTYEARILAPNSNQIAYATNWAYQKPGYSSSLSTQVNDTDEGTYTCAIDWWAYSTHLTYQTAPFTLTYAVPTGESTAGVGWHPFLVTAGNFQQTLQGGSFIGRMVREEDGGNGDDDYWFPTSEKDKFEAVTPINPWTVDGDNKWGPDTLGWGTAFIIYYRQENVNVPCQTQFDQKMYIRRPGVTDYHYVTQVLKTGFTMTEVWSERAGQRQTKIWP